MRIAKHIIAKGIGKTIKIWFNMQRPYSICPSRSMRLLLHFVYICLDEISPKTIFEEKCVR